MSKAAITETSERPIIFSAQSIAAIMTNAKTQTRRVAKLDSNAKFSGGNLARAWVDPGMGGVPYLQVPCEENGNGWGGSTQRVRCPYGYPGDKLWVREAYGISYGHAGDGSIGGKDPDCVVYKSDYRIRAFQGKTFLPEDWPFHDTAWVVDEWRNPLFMPRWMSRLTLEIVSVRVERLQSITREDAMAEGITQHRYEGGLNAFEDIESHEWDNRTSVENFAWLWDRLNGKKKGCAWADSPWVWAISFKVVLA